MNIANISDIVEINKSLDKDIISDIISDALASFLVKKSYNDYLKDIDKSISAIKNTEV